VGTYGDLCGLVGRVLTCENLCALMRNWEYLSGVVRACGHVLGFVGRLVGACEDLWGLVCTCEELWRFPRELW